MNAAASAELLYLASSLALVVLGIVHGAQTVLDVFAPRFFAPESDALQAEMRQARLRFSRRLVLWPSWLGFNLTHALGLCVIGALLASLEPRLIAESAFLRWFPALVCAAYALIAARCFFWLPASAYAVIALSFTLAALA